MRPLTYARSVSEGCRRQALLPILLLSILLGACSESPASQVANLEVPTLHPISAASASAAGDSVLRALALPTWDGSWRLIARDESEPSVASLAATIYGSPKDADRLQHYRFVAVSNSFFEIRANGVPDDGDFGLTVIQFNNSSDASRFFSTYSATRGGASLPGVPGGALDGTVQSSACPGSECGLAGFTFRRGNLVLTGASNCNFGSACEVLSGLIGRAVHTAMVKTQK